MFKVGDYIMNAIKFIKEHGVEKAREVVDNHHECYMPEVFKYWSEQLQDYVLAPKYASFLVSELKRLVYSVDLVNCNGGWNGTKNTITLFQSSLDLGLYHGVDGVDAEVEIPRLKQAIADYEVIYGGEHV